jgi:hypothetical protein
VNTFSNFVKESLISAGYTVKKISRCTSSSVWAIMDGEEELFSSSRLGDVLIEASTKLGIQRRVHENHMER